ncbi:MAG TPA: hypothetical protein PKY86_08045, partial [Niabella sp.]|nr:hypothetical protein [Niabella sp.]
MEIIINNPFRILGLYAGAKTSLLNKNFNKLRMYVEAEQEIPDEFNQAIFPCLGIFHRTKESIESASSHLNLDHDKMIAALFWFYEGNPITDEPAFDELREANIQSASEIWKKLVERGVVTERNFSAFQNISTLYLLRAFKGSFPDSALLTSAIKLKLQFLESDFALKYKAVVTDTTFKISKDDLQLLFLHEIESEIQKNKKYKEIDLIDILGNIDFKAKPEFLKGFVQKPIEQIEKKIAEARVKRKANPANSVNIGNTLYNETVENLNQLKSILGITNLKFSSISDKVSDEILQCGIDYFSHYKDTDTDPGIASMDLFRKAKTLAFGNIAKQRCQENTEGLQEWIDEKPERDKQAKILVDFEKLKNLIDEFEGRSGTVANGKQLLISAKPYLNTIKSVLGNFDELYLGISSRIASDAQGMCVVEINKLQEKIANTYDNRTKVSALLLLKEKVNEAWDVTTTIGEMDLSQDFRTRYSQNRTSLTNLKTQLTNIKKSKSKRNNNGCLWVVLIIATIFILSKIFESPSEVYTSPETSYTPQNENETN